MSETLEIRQRVVDVSQELLRRGLVEGTSGNVSARVDEHHAALTPSSVPYETMTADQIVICNLDGDVVEGEGGPTSEKALHLSVYRKYPEIGGAIHSHAVFATMFAVNREPIPAAIEEVAVYVGGDIPCAEYRTTGTDELGEVVSDELAERGAVLVANHGMVTIGTTVEKALHNASLVERTAQIVWGARLMGKPHDVPAEVNKNFGDVYKLMRTM